MLGAEWLELGYVFYDLEETLYRSVILREFEGRPTDVEHVVILTTHILAYPDLVCVGG